MRKILYTCILILTTLAYHPIYSQEIKSDFILTVIDKIYQAPIPEVYVINKTKSIYTVTDKNGMANLKGFYEDDSVIFQRTNYTDLSMSFQDIKRLDNIIELSLEESNIEGITIFANKWEQDFNEFPYTTHGMDKLKLNKLDAGSSADALGNLPAVFIQKSQLGGGSPMIRGFAANGVLIVVNNFRMNNAIFRSGNLQNVINIQPSIIEGLEVIYGPGSLTYGSDAMGGVMDFHTKRPKLNFTKDYKFDINYGAHYKTATNNRNVFLDANIANNKLGSRSVLTFNDFGSLKAGKNHYGSDLDFGKRIWVQGTTIGKQDTMIKNSHPNEMYPSSFTSQSFLQSFVYKHNSKIKISYDFIFSNTSDIPRYDRLIQMTSDDTLKYGEWYYGPQTWIMNSITLDNSQKTKYYDEFKVGISHQYFKESRHDRKFGSTTLRNRQEKVQLWSVNSDFSKKINANFSLYYGGEISYNDVQSEAYSEDIITSNITPVSTRYPDELNHYWTSGIYGNSKYVYNKNLSFIGGIRISFFHLKSKFSNQLLAMPFNEIKMTNFAPTASLGTAWRINKELQLNGNISTAYRAPNIDDASKIFDSEPGNVVVPNADLKPEYALSSEASIHYYPNKDISLNASVFYTYVFNVMVRRDFTFNGNDSILYDNEWSKVQAIVNDDHGKIYGIDFEGVYRFPFNLKTTANFTFLKGYDSQGFALRHVPPFYGRVDFSYPYKDFDLLAYTQFSGGIKYNDLAPEEQAKTHLYSVDGSPAWFTINLAVSYKLNKKILLKASLENILDRFYIPYSSGIASPGRSLNLSIKSIF